MCVDAAREMASVVARGRGPHGDALHTSILLTDRSRDVKKSLGLVCVIAILCSGGPAVAQDGPDIDPDAPLIEDQITRFVRRIFEDSTGAMWFGTNGDGVIRCAGPLVKRALALGWFPEGALEYFSINEGFGGVAVRGIVEDAQGNVWFGTEGGVTRYDGHSFTNYTEADGLASNDVWSIAIDRDGLIWVGTLEGISRFDGEEFTPFAIPDAEPDPLRGVTSAKIVHSIMEDSKGRMWFGTGGGAYVFDGQSLTNISAKDGLCGDSVNCILEGRDGTMWFATHHTGVCSWDGAAFTHFDEDHGVEGIEAWSLLEDSAGNVWFPVEHSGVYRFDGKTFTNFAKKDGLASPGVQCVFEDRAGRIWAGGWLGLYCFDGTSFTNVTATEPGQ